MKVRYVRFDGAVVSAQMAALLTRCRHRGWSGRLDGPRSGARTFAQQLALWELFAQGRGSPAFDPRLPDPLRRRRHMRANIEALGGWSQAVDVSRPDELIAEARKEGVALRRPYPREPWHVEAAGAWRLKPRGGAVPSDAVLVSRMRSGRPRTGGRGRLRIANPAWTLRAARRTGLPLALACALLEQESGGGRNVFGHDPTDAVPAAWRGGPVTRLRYAFYKRRRRAGKGMQGVGPCQLTWWQAQDRADAIGGCWRPLPNMIVGFGALRASVRAHGLRAGIEAYNGSGAAARKYASEVLVRTARWQAYLFR